MTAPGEEDRLALEWFGRPGDRFNLECEYCPWVEADILAVEDGAVLVREWHYAGCRYAAWCQSEDPDEPAPWDVDRVLDGANHILWLHARDTPT